MNNFFNSGKEFFKRSFKLDMIDSLVFFSVFFNLYLCAQGLLAFFMLATASFFAVKYEELLKNKFKDRKAPFYLNQYFVTYSLVLIYYQNYRFAL